MSEIYVTALRVGPKTSKSVNVSNYGIELDKGWMIQQQQFYISLSPDQQPLKKPIIDDGLAVFVNDIIVPDSGWTPENPDNRLPNDYAWTGVYRNTTGCLR